LCSLHLRIPKISLKAIKRKIKMPKKMPSSKKKNLIKSGRLQTIKFCN
jgi:hypothetical protein